jgi:hypothetical protein
MAAGDSNLDFVSISFVQKFSFRNTDKVICSACLAAGSGRDNDRGRVGIPLRNQPVVKELKLVDGLKSFHE